MGSVLLACAVLLACTSGRKDLPSSAVPPAEALSATLRELPEGVVARVGTMEIRAEEVAGVARTQHLQLAEALSLQIRDALFASAAVHAHYDETPSVRAALRGQLARAVLTDLRARSQEPSPTDVEVAEATARHFLELDRPEASRVIHAVVRMPERPDPATKERARGVAERILRAAAGASNAAEFRAKVGAVDRAGLEVVIDELLPVAADGRVIDVEHPGPPRQETEHFVLPFARAAARLTEPGQKSGIIETEFGFHVAMLLEHLEARTVRLEERRTLLRDEIFTTRAKKRADALVRTLRSAYPPLVDRSAEVLISSLVDRSP